MRYSGWFLAVVCVGMMFSSADGRAADLKVKSKIGSVVVFPQGAQVTRDFTVEVPQGAHSIVLEGLPHELQRRSLRIEATGAAGLEIGPLDHKVETVPFEKQQHHALKVELETRLAAFHLPFNNPLLGGDKFITHQPIKCAVKPWQTGHISALAITNLP